MNIYIDIYIHIFVGAYDQRYKLYKNLYIFMIFLSLKSSRPRINNNLTVEPLKK